MLLDGGGKGVGRGGGGGGVKAKLRVKLRWRERLLRELLVPPVWSRNPILESSTSPLPLPLPGHPAMPPTNA
jgi:hypothetical protein